MHNEAHSVDAPIASGFHVAHHWRRATDARWFAMTRALLIFGLLALSVGCHSNDYNARVFHPWGCENAKEFKAQFREYKNILMVCISEDHWEDRGPNRYSLHHLKGTVVTVYKGD